MAINKNDSQNYGVAQNTNYTVYSNTLYILESLVEEEKTGKWLSEDLMSLKHVDGGYDIIYISFESKKQFFEELAKIKLEIENQGKFPTIHIEAHGDKGGFDVAHTKEDINWRELNIELSEINFLCQNNLILTLGICNGKYIDLDLINFFNAEKPCPYIVNISPYETIESSDIKLGFSKFYQSLLKNKVLSIAMNEMKGVTPLNIKSTADEAAKIVINHIKFRSKNKDFTIKSAKDLQYLIQRGAQPLPNEKFNQNMKYVKKFKREFFREELERKWSIFLMINDFEENKSRFEDFDVVWGQERHRK